MEDTRVNVFQGLCIIHKSRDIDSSYNLWSKNVYLNFKQSQWRHTNINSKSVGRREKKIKKTMNSREGKEGRNTDAKKKPGKWKAHIIH